MRENQQSDSRFKGMMEWEVSTEILRILIYTTDNALLTFIEIGNTGKWSGFRGDRGKDGLCNIQIKCLSWVYGVEHRGKIHVET